MTDRHGDFTVRSLEIYEFNSSFMSTGALRVGIGNILLLSVDIFALTIHPIIIEGRKTLDVAKVSSLRCPIE
jgi:hypothetical protein